MLKKYTVVPILMAQVLILFQLKSYKEARAFAVVGEAVRLVVVEKLDQ